MSKHNPEYPKAHLADYGPCPKCGERMFTCVLCGGRFHSAGTGPAVRAPAVRAPNDTSNINPNYVACSPCAVELTARAAAN